MIKATAKSVLKIARETKGTYLMGGTGPGQWDCSGFVGHCLGAPYGTRYFITNGEKDWILANVKGAKDVSNQIPNGLKPGDILVFNRPGTDGAFANGHTEIYNGNGMTIGAHGPQGYFVGLGDRSVSACQWQDAVRLPGGVCIIRYVGQKPGDTEE